MAELQAEASGIPALERPKLRNFKPRARKSRHAARRGPLVSKPLTRSALVHEVCDKDPVDKGPESPADGVPAKKFLRRRGASFSPLRNGSKSRRGSPSSGCDSPARGLDPGSEESVQRRIQRLASARLYLLQHPEPHTFVIGGDSPEQKCRVIIGPQSCSCGGPAPCLHLLFVMVRVLRLPENDRRLLCCPLKNEEVELMLGSLQRRRLSRLSRQLNGAVTPPSDPVSARPAAEDSSDDGSCPICLLDLSDGETVVRCETGCRNLLHRHCMAVWAEESQRGREAVLCPLCRAAWPPQTDLTPGGGGGSYAVRRGRPGSLSPGSDATLSPGSPAGEARREAPLSPCSDPDRRRRGSVSSCDAELGGRPARRGSVVSASDASPRSPQLGRRAAGRGSLRRAALKVEGSVERKQTWTQALGRELVQLVLSPNWQSRDKGMHRLAEELAGLERRPGGRSADDLLVSLADLLAALCADPVHKVFLGAISCLQMLLRHLRPSCADDICRLRSALTPLVEALLLRSADSARRSAQLSCWTLAQLALGPAGQLLAAELGGLQLVLDCLLQDCRSGADSWRWCLGRLLVADHLISTLPEQFRASPLGGAAGGRVAQIAEFAQRALTHPHATVAQLARRVFVQMALAADADPTAHAHVAALMAALEPGLQLRLKRRMRAVWEGANGGRPDRASAAAAAGTGPGSAGNSTPSGPPPPPATGRRPRPNFLPLDAAAGFRKKRGQLRRGSPVLTERPAALRHALYSPPEPAPALSAESTPSTMDVDAAWHPLTPAESVEEIIVYPHNQTMEGDSLVTYAEGVQWRKGPLLGTGAFSACYQACDLASGRLMAVKQLHVSDDCGADSPAERAARETALREELELLAGLRHPHVLRLLGATRRPAVMNLFTEWEAGGSVAGLLQRYGPMSAEVTRRYAAHLTDGLAYLHDCHVLHRDLKGANLLVDSSGQHLKIGDFGTAAVLGADRTIKGEFSGQVLGTVAFMAPEVLRGHHYGRSSDIWSVGCCVIEMITGNPPWDAHTCSNHFALLFRIAGSTAPPPVPSHLPADLRELVSDCLRVEADERPAAKHLLHYPCFKALA